MITLSVDRKESVAFAERYARLKNTGTLYLPLREVSGLIRRHVKGGMAALDYGCGPGKSSLFLRSLGLHVDGVDVNPNMISQVRRRIADGNFQLLNDGRIPAGAEHYDLVFCSWVLTEIGTRCEATDAICEIVRVLKPDGTFIAVVCSEDCYNEDWLNMNTEFEENKNLSSGCIVKTRLKDIDVVLDHYFWTHDDYREMMQKAGLCLVETRRPLGRDDDGYAWVNEKLKSPFTVYVAKKKKKSNLGNFWL